MKEVGLMCIVISQIPKSLHCYLFHCMPTRILPHNMCLTTSRKFLPEGSVIATFCHY